MLLRALFISAIAVLTYIRPALTFEFKDLDGDVTWYQTNDEVLEWSFDASTDPATFALFLVGQLNSGLVTNRTVALDMLSDNEYYTIKTSLLMDVIECYFEAWDTSEGVLLAKSPEITVKASTSTSAQSTSTTSSTRIASATTFSTSAIPQTSASSASTSTTGVIATTAVPATVTSSSLSAPTAQAASVTTSSSGLNTGAKIGIAIGIVAIALLAAILGLMLWRRRKQRYSLASQDLPSHNSYPNTLSINDEVDHRYQRRSELSGTATTAWTADSPSIHEKPGEEDLTDSPTGERRLRPLTFELEGSDVADMVRIGSPEP